VFATKRFSKSNPCCQRGTIAAPVGEEIHFIYLFLFIKVFLWLYLDYYHGERQLWFLYAERALLQILFFDCKSLLKSAAGPNVGYGKGGDANALGTVGLGGLKTD
jgi:hypothetical protein